MEKIDFSKQWEYQYSERDQSIICGTFSWSNKINVSASAFVSKFPGYWRFRVECSCSEEPMLHISLRDCDASKDRSFQEVQSLIEDIITAFLNRVIE
jgi:hypothetical protein